MNDCSRLVGEEIRIQIGHRLYELFCPDCHDKTGKIQKKISEGNNLERLVCSQCDRCFGYRLPADEERAIWEVAFMGPDRISQ